VHADTKMSTKLTSRLLYTFWSLEPKGQNLTILFFFRFKFWHEWPSIKTSAQNHIKLTPLLSEKLMSALVNRLPYTLCSCRSVVCTHTGLPVPYRAPPHHLKPGSAPPHRINSFFDKLQENFAGFLYTTYFKPKRITLFL